MLPTLATPKFPSPISDFNGSMNMPKEYPIPIINTFSNKLDLSIEHILPFGMLQLYSNDAAILNLLILKLDYGPIQSTC